MLATPRIRLLVLAILPVIVSAAVMSTLVVFATEKRLTSQSEYFAKTITAYLAMTTAEYLINDDVLGINILLTRLQEEGALDFASVYGADNQLIAQVGQRHPDATSIFSREVTFQDTAAGYIQAGFNDHTILQYRDRLFALVLLFHGVLIAFLTLLILFAADFIGLWVFQSGSAKANESIEEAPEIPASEVEEAPGAAVLVVKLRPVRLMDVHRHQLERAASLYGGRTDIHGDDLLVQFRGETGIFQACCSALLLLTLVRHIGPPLKLKLGIHWLPDTGDDLAVETANKHTSYLASIGEQVVLVSRAFEAQLGEQDEISYEPFHSSLTPDGEVFQVTRVKNQALIDSQALQLLNSA